MEVEPDIDWNNCMVPSADNPEILDLSACQGKTEKVCPDGVLDITRCMGGAPVHMSSPHFFQSPEYLVNDLLDFPPPEGDKYETQLDIEPNTGIAISVHKRIQASQRVTI